MHTVAQAIARTDLLNAFNISMVTRIERDTVDAVCAISCVKILQPASMPRASRSFSQSSQSWKWLCGRPEALSKN